MNRSKAKTSYTKLTSRQRMEILDYWSKNHYPYSVICNYFSEKWHQEVKKTTVGDLILQWKRKNYIRGVNKVDSIDRELHSLIRFLKVLKMFQSCNKAIPHQIRSIWTRFNSFITAFPTGLTAICLTPNTCHTAIGWRYL